MATKVVIFVFDGLRPDMVTPVVMPNLHRFAQAGTLCTGSRVAFPTETRVNQATLVTGCWPARHGIVGNRFMDPAAAGGSLINSGDEDQLRAASDALEGRLLDVPSLGEILAERGMSLAVAGSGTAGGTRILHHRAEALGDFRLSLYRPDASTPVAEVQAVVDKLGPIPEAKVPALERTTYLLNTFFEEIAPRLAPQVTILWSFEPDISYHYSGLGTEDNLSALGHADAQFGRLVDWRNQLPSDERPTLLTLSDHGHLAIEGEPIGVAGKLAEAGFSVGPALTDEVDAALFCQRAGGIYVRDREGERVAEIAGWLRAQPWCELVFTDALPDTLSLADAGIAHRRAPDIAFVTTAHDGTNAAGLPGRCTHDTSGLATDGGLHGGLHPIELGNWFALQGASNAGIETRRVIDTPCGIVDVLPTVLHLLGIEVEHQLDGRVLHELLGEVLPDASVGTVESVAAGMVLERSTFAGATYLERGYRR